MRCMRMSFEGARGRSSSRMRAVKDKVVTGARFRSLFRRSTEGAAQKLSAELERSRSSQRSSSRPKELQKVQKVQRKENRKRFESKTKQSKERREQLEAQSLPSWSLGSAAQRLKGGPGQADPAWKRQDEKVNKQEKGSVIEDRPPWSYGIEALQAPISLRFPFIELHRMKGAVPIHPEPKSPVKLAQAWGQRVSSQDVSRRHGRVSSMALQAVRCRARGRSRGA